MEGHLLRRGRGPLRSHIGVRRGKDTLRVGGEESCLGRGGSKWSLLLLED